MPAEWNELVASIYTWNGPQWMSNEESYCQASTDKILPLSEVFFDRLSVMLWRSKWPMPIRLHISDESKLRITTFRERYVQAPACVTVGVCLHK